MKLVRNFVKIIDISFLVVLPLLIAGIIFFPENSTAISSPSVLSDITSNVTVFTVCGDNSKQGLEECDGSDLGAETCVSQGYVAGTLSCNANCTLNTSQCTIPGGGVCGNNIVETGEECDGSDLQSATCVSRSFDSGTLSCYNNCTYNEAQCVNQAQVTQTPGGTVTATNIPGTSISPTPAVTVSPTGSQSGVDDEPVVTPTIIPDIAGETFWDHLFSPGLLNCLLLFTFGISPFALVVYLLVKKKKLGPNI